MQALVLVAVVALGAVPRVVDDGSVDFSATVGASISQGSGFFGGSAVRLSGPSQRAAFRFVGVPAGTYNVALTWSAASAPGALQDDAAVVVYDGEEMSGTAVGVAVINQQGEARGDFAAVDLAGQLGSFQGVSQVTVTSGVCTVVLVCGESSGEALADAALLVPAGMGVGDNPLLGELVEQGTRAVWLLTALAISIGLLWGAVTWGLIVYAKNQHGLW